MLEEVKTLIKKEKKNYIDVATILVLIAFIAQYLWVVFENLFNISKYLGFDQSINLLYIITAGKERTLFSSNFASTTGQFCMPFEGTLYAILGKVFIAQGIPNVIRLTVVLFIEYHIVKKLINSEKYHLFYVVIIFFITICPFVNSVNAKELNYASCMTYPVAYYMKYIISELIVLLTYYSLAKDGWSGAVKRKIAIVIGGVYVLAAIIPKPEFLGINVLLPMMICTILIVLCTNDYKVIKRAESVYTFVLILMVCVAKVLNKFLVVNETATSKMHWLSREEFPSNVFNVLTAYFEITGGMAEKGKQSVYSLGTVSFVLGMVVSCCLLGVFLYVLKAGLTKREEATRCMPLIAIVLFDTLFYCFFDLTYGANEGSIFASRYLIFSFYALFFCIAICCSELEDTLILKSIGVFALVFSLMIITLLSNHYRIESREDTARLDEIKLMIDEYQSDATLVYFVGSVNDDVRYMRVWDPDRVYKDIWVTGELFHWGDYTYSDEAADYQGPYMIFCRKDSTDVMPKYVSNSVEQVGEWDEYYIYRGVGTKYDFKSSEKSTINYEFPYSPSVTIDHMEMNESGEYISDGSEGIIVYGPNYQFEKGVYDITLEYELLGANADAAGVFDVVKNESEVAFSTAIPNSDQNTIEFKNVVGDGNTWYQYRVGEAEGTTLRINKIIINKVESY